MWILDYFEEEREKRAVNGEIYTIRCMARELGVSAAYMSILINGKRIITPRMADQFEKKTSGRIDANDLIEKSIERHLKYLDRKKKFGDRVH